MKLIIDIPDELYKHIHNENVYYLEDGEDLYTIVKNGTIYAERPQGDLISREALKKAIDTITQIGYDIDNEPLFDYVELPDLIRIIDKAPTVHTEDCEGCPYCPNSNSGIPIGVE